MARTFWSSLILFSLLVSCQALDTVTFKVFEEREPGTFVGDVSNSTIVQTLKANENLTGRLRFQFLVPEITFSINASTGIIRTEAKLDREDLSLDDDTFQTQVEVSKGQFVIVNIPIAIKVLDINDNKPSFRETVQNIEVSESAPLGAELEVTVAEDKDIGSNTVQSYEILSGNEQGNFRLKVSRPTSQLTKVKLVVAKRLDREKNDSFYLVIEARDAGKPSGVVTKGLNITVLDSNDRIPKFSKDLYSGEVKENSPKGTFVLQVTASDEDIGTNAEIVFSLKSRPQDENLFVLDTKTGELRTNAILNYELSKAYQLEVIAKDKGPDSIPSSAAVTVQVLDENDNKPEITVTNIPVSFDQTGRLPEDIPLRTSLAVVTVNDKDSGRNSRVTVTLQHHKQDFGLAEMFPGKYLLEVKRPLSLDRHKQYKIKIVAEDQGFPTSLRNSRVFVVKLADSNRNAPVFSQNVYNLKVRDDVTVGEVITIVTATDGDSGRNAELTYAIEGVSIEKRNGTEEDKSKWFSIDPTTGRVRVMTKLWCAFTSSFRLQIDVKDKGRVPLHGKTALNISVQCSQRYIFNFSVAENELEGTEVGRIPFSSVSPERPLHIRLLPDANQDFAVDENTGVLTAKRLLDREAEASYLLIAVLSDGNAEVKLAVNIKIVDDNDNAPVFIGLKDHGNITLTKPVFIGETILKIEAVDKDAGSNGQVQYAIVGGNDNQVFRINKRNGRITLRKQLNKTWYHLTIRVSDSGVIEEESFLRLSISVSFITPAPPSSSPTTTNVGVVDRRKGGDFFEDTKMIIIIAVAVGFLLLTISLIAVFCIKDRRKREKKPEEADNRGSYHEPDISREDALMASKKMFDQATAKQRQSPKIFTSDSRQKTVNVSPYPIKKMHSMPYQTAGTGSPTGPVKPDMYYPIEQEPTESGSSDDELDSGRGGSSRSSPYCMHSPPSKKKEESWSHPHVRYTASTPYRAPGLPPSPPPYEEVPRRQAFVTISAVTHSTTDL